MQENKRNVFLLIISLILLLLSCALIIVGLLIQFNYITLDDNKNGLYKANQDKNVVLEKELSLDDETVNNLLSLVKGKETLQKHSYKAEYLDSFYYKITTDTLVADINNDNLLKILWFNLKDSDDKQNIEGGFVIDVDKFKETYQNIFGDNIPFSKDTTSTTASSCLKVNYNTANDNYEFYNTCKSNSDIIVFPKLVKAVKTDGEINIYEKVAFYSKGTLYEDIDLRNKIVEGFKEENLDQYSDFLKTYIYTFKLDTKGNYYFYKISIE